VATFGRLTLTQAGKYTISAADGKLPSIKTMSFTVTPDLATSQLKAVLVPQGTSVVGKALSPSLMVDVVDQFGNVITSDHSAATISIVTGPLNGTISGLTTVNAVGGVLTFKNLALPVTGDYTLQVMDSTLEVLTPVVVMETLSPGVTTVGGLPATTTKNFGQSVGLTATFKSTAPTTVPFTGAATLVDNASNVMGTATLTSAGAAKFNLTDLTPGTYTCSVSYPGDGSHTAINSAAFKIQINPAATTMFIATSTNAPVVGQTFTIATQVNSTTAPDSVPTGTISFYDGSTLIGTSPVDENSRASLTLTAAGVGRHSYRAIYSGDGTFKGSVSPALARNINRDAISIAFTSSVAGPLSANQTFNLNVHVAVLAPGVAELNGTPITIKDNGKELAMIDLDDNGDSAYTEVSFSAPGIHNLTASYGGDADLSAVSSSILKLVVQ
jgi:hypothetical protein